MGSVLCLSVDSLFCWLSLISGGLSKSCPINEGWVLLPFVVYGAGRCSLCPENVELSRPFVSLIKKGDEAAYLERTVSLWEYLCSSLRG